MMLKKSFSQIAVLLLILATLAGCGSGNSTSPSTNAGNGSSAETTAKPAEAPYTVYFAYHAPKEGNQAEVEEAISQLTMKDLNMKVKLIPIGFDTYMSKFPAMLAAKEPMDISFVFTFVSAASFLDAGYIVDASKYSDYTKDIVKVLGEDANVGYYGDFLAGFPVNNVRSAPSAIFVRKDIFEALGYKESDFNVTTDDMSSFNQITKMLARIKEKYPDITPLNGHRIFGQNTITYVDTLTDGFGVLENYGQSDKVTNWYESDQFKQFAMLTREWFTKGYTSKDIAVDQELGQAKMKAGNCAAFFASYTANQLVAVKGMTGYDCVMIPVSQKMKSTTTANGVLNSVMYQSQNKEKAFKFLNWCYTNGDFNDYLNWGVPGKDWIVNKDGQADYPEGVTMQNVNYHADFGFIYPNQYLMHPWAGSPKDVWDQLRQFDSNAIVSKGYGFTYDSGNVANEVAQCGAVLSKYESDISFGAVDPETGLAKLNKDLYDAGLKKIMDEKQKQLDAWLAKK